MPKSYCIICGQQKEGIEVQNDFVLDAMRWFKKNITRDVRGNRLVVCKLDYAKYASDRKRFESRQRLYLALGIMFALASLFVNPRISTLIISAFLMVMLYLFSLLNYTPKISIKNQHKQ